MKKRILLCLAAAWCLSLQAAGGIDRLKGCWADTATAQWTYAFFDRFAIFRNDFWTYDRIELQRRKGTVALRRGNERVTLHLRFVPGRDSLCTITPATGGTPATVRLCRVPPVPRETADVPALPTGYAADSAIVRGYIPFHKSPEGILLRAPSPFAEEDFEIRPRVDSLGRFTAIVPVTGAPAVHINNALEGLFMPAILPPGDTLTLYADEEGRIFLMGRCADFNREIIEGHRRLGTVRYADWHRSKDLSPEEWKTVCMDELRLKRQVLATYAQDAPTLSRQAADYLDRSIALQCAGQMLQKAFTLKRRQFERFPSSFLHTVDSLLALARPPYTAYDDLSYALNNFCHYHSSPLPSSVTWPATTLADYLHRNGIHTFSDRERADLLLLEEGISMSFSLESLQADSAMWKERMAPYLDAMERAGALTQSEEFRQLAKAHQDKIKTWEIRRNLEKDLAPLRLLHVADSLKAFHAACVVLHELDRRRAPFPQEIIGFARERLSDPELYAFVSARQERYQRLQGQDLSHPQSLKTTEALEGIGSPDSLWAEILRPYRGKIVYVDFWGTWCEPCKLQMKAVPALKASLADEDDIVFLYLAVHSPEESWLNFLKENDLTGRNSVHYNLPPEMGQALTRHLSIQAYPTYLLIDRDGRMADRQPPTPRDGDRLAGYLRRMAQGAQQQTQTENTP